MGFGVGVGGVGVWRLVLVALGFRGLVLALVLGRFLRTNAPTPALSKCGQGHDENEGQGEGERVRVRVGVRLKVQVRVRVRGSRFEV